MNLSDKHLESYVTEKLALPGDDRNEYRQQVNRLLDKLESRSSHADGSYKIKKFRHAGSLEKGTSDRPRPGKPVDADVGVYFDVDDLLLRRRRAATADQGATRRGVPAEER